MELLIVGIIFYIAIAVGIFTGEFSQSTLIATISVVLGFIGAFLIIIGILKVLQEHNENQGYAVNPEPLLIRILLVIFGGTPLAIILQALLFILLIWIKEYPLYLLAIVGICAIIIVSIISFRKIKNNISIKKTHKKSEKEVRSQMSKRIAAIISITLCFFLYLTLLTTVFTTERDTYICYTTKTGECFHSADCRYLNTAYETTVYEASKKYKVCNYCDPCVTRYETTITVRDFVSPLLISAPISLVIFVLIPKDKEYIP